MCFNLGKSLPSGLMLSLGMSHKSKSIPWSLAEQGLLAVEFRALSIEIVKNFPGGVFSNSKIFWLQVEMLKVLVLRECKIETLWTFLMKVVSLLQYWSISSFIFSRSRRQT